jgi:hypothetical protein
MKNIVFYTIIFLLLLTNIINFNKKDNSIKLLNYRNQEFSKSVDSLNREILNQKTIIANNSDDLKFLLDSVEKINLKIKTPKVFVKNSSVISIKDTFIKYDTITVYNDSLEPIRLKCASFEDAWVNVDICDVDSGLRINNIAFKDTSTIIIHKTGLFKTKYNTTVINNNPYKVSDNLNSIIVKEKKFKKITIAAGVAIGAAIIILAF